MIFDPQSSILVIFCKRPKLGNGKQRIAGELGTQRALEISDLLLEATLADAGEWPGPVVLSPAAKADETWAAKLLPHATVIPQPEGTLGERLLAVDLAIRSAGGRKIIFIGTDAPGLTPAIMQDAAAMLEQNDAVLIPARDGGVVLMGAARPWPDLGKLPWETSGLGQALSKACRTNQMATALLTEAYDLDTSADLRYAQPLLQTDKRATRQAIYGWIDTSLPHAGNISVVIPVMNDLPALENLLGRLLGFEGIHEIIVVDGSPDGNCRQLCSESKSIWLQSEACRGKQMHLGALEARGQTLWFLHADSNPPAESPTIIRTHTEDGFNGGYFRFRFAGPKSLLRTLLELAINLRTRIGIPYGDQGIFIDRETYLECGGFSDEPLFEEVELIRKLRKGFRFAEVPATIDVSPRRWERDGWIKRSLHNRYLALGYSLGIPPEKLALRYRAPKSG